MKLYQAEWCPFSHRVRAKLTELGIGYEVVNVSASARERREIEEIAGTKAIPVLVDGERVISDSGEAISYLEEKYEADPEELKLHRRELSPTVYGTLPFGVEEAAERLREALGEADIEVLEELDLSQLLGTGGTYRVLLAVDREFARLAAEANPGAATLTLLKIAVYEEDGLTRVDAIEPEKGAGQIRAPELNDRGLELRKRFIKTIKTLERPASSKTRWLSAPPGRE
ncbi:MAG: glutathione S-transferase N-terminal domain-containing protein [Actinomycetota bacterium]|nr:glutathione S-transferase N-terminal domain-containing protein [Actinomycetota bacterium]